MQFGSVVLMLFLPKNNFMIKIFSFYLFLFTTLLFAQKVETKFVMGRGKFIFDKESYLIQKKKLLKL